MPNVLDALEEARFLVSKGRGQEPAKLVLPRIEAQRRRENKEKRTRVQFDCDEQTYSDFHAQRSRYIEACQNHPLIAYAVMIRCLAQLSDEVIKRLAEDAPFTEGLESA
jgi:hypothetical protein